jgi:hypothetical protein
MEPPYDSREKERPAYVEETMETFIYIFRFVHTLNLNDVDTMCTRLKIYTYYKVSWGMRLLLKRYMEV